MTAATTMVLRERCMLGLLWAAFIRAGTHETRLTPPRGLADRSVLRDLGPELPVLHAHPYPRLPVAVREAELDVVGLVGVDLGREAGRRRVRHQREATVRESHGQRSAR